MFTGFPCSLLLNSHLPDILKSAGNRGWRRGSRSSLGFSIPRILGKISQGGSKGGLRGAGATTWCWSKARRGGGSLCQIWGGGGLSWGEGEKFGETEGEGAGVGRRQWQSGRGGGGGKALPLLSPQLLLDDCGTSQFSTVCCNMIFTVCCIVVCGYR